MKKFVLLGCVCGLTACGGGGVVSEGYGLKTVAQSSDGEDALIRIYDGAGTEKMVGVGTLTAVETARSGSTAGWTSISESQDGDLYYFERSTVMSNGGDLVVIGAGENLNASGTEYVSMFLGYTDDGVAIFATGTPSTSLPNGNYNYQGTATFIDSTSDVLGEDGTFGMSVNFGAATASITGASDNYIFTDSQITINATNGEFSSTSATLGPRNGVKVPATLEGNFYGSNATGVGGVVVSDLSQDDGYLSVFKGSR